MPRNAREHMVNILGEGGLRDAEERGLIIDISPLSPDQQLRLRSPFLLLSTSYFSSAQLGGPENLGVRIIKELDPKAYAEYGVVQSQTYKKGLLVSTKSQSIGEMKMYERTWNDLIKRHILRNSGFPSRSSVCPTRLSI